MGEHDPDADAVGQHGSQTWRGAVVDINIGVGNWRSRQGFDRPDGPAGWLDVVDESGNFK